MTRARPTPPGRSTPSCGGDPGAGGSIGNTVAYDGGALSVHVFRRDLRALRRPRRLLTRAWPASGRGRATWARRWVLSAADRWT
ncbi:hypothetical protein [Nonomuraea dietziae]|uniref:hypothetical protein n=1 Tax=Nonomuraea dietziae TaxID=65515 RepID=UPI0031E13F60